MDWVRSSTDICEAQRVSWGRTLDFYIAALVDISPHHCVVHRSDEISGHFQSTPSVACFRELPSPALSGLEVMSLQLQRQDSSHLSDSLVASQSGKSRQSQSSFDRDSPHRLMTT